MQISFRAAVVVACLPAIGRASPWLDFESGAGEWTAHGDIVVAASVPPAAEGAPTGLALRVRGTGGTILLTTPDPPPGITNAAILRFRCWRPPDAPATAAEIQFFDTDLRSRLWRRFEPEPGGWRTVEMPLRFFRSFGARIPSWETVRRFAIRLRGETEIWVDDVEWVEQPGLGPALELRELREIAFPNAPSGTVRLVRAAEYAVMTDCAELDLALTRAALESLTRDLRLHFPFLPPPPRPATLLVFAREEDYRSFPPRLAERLLSAASPPTTDGFTILGIATSYWSPEKGSMRPVFFHEFVHAWLSQAGGLVCEGHWLHEAVANWCQLRLFPEDGFDAHIRRLIETGAMRPLRELCSDRPVRRSDYAQLVAVYRMLFSREPYRSRLPELFKAVRERSSFDLDRSLRAAFGVDWQQLEADWRSFCAETYGAAPA